MRVSELLKRTFFTRKCILCNDVIDYDFELPFCEECYEQWLVNLDFMCVKCGMDSDYCTCLPDRIKEINPSLSTFGVFYSPGAETPVNRLVYSLKRDYNMENIRFCAKILAKKVLKKCFSTGVNYKDFIVTYPPRRKKPAIKYGYDHAQLLAREFAKILGLKVVKAFKNVGKEEQKSLTKSGRLSNAAESYELLENVDVKNKSIFIVDDVMTSGATLNICSKMLLLSGAKVVAPVAFAKDTHHKIND